MSKYKPKINHPNALPYSKPVEKHLRRGLKAGLPMTSILDSMQELQHAPVSTGTLYKIYGSVIAEERFNLQEKIGKAVLDKVGEGDSKLIEFAARSKAGWNPSVNIKEVDKDDPDEATDAISRLAQLLGKEKDPE